MAFCNICGSNVPDGAATCPICGSVMASQSPRPEAAPNGAPQPTPTAAPVNPYSQPSGQYGNQNPYSPQGTYTQPTGYAQPVQPTPVASPYQDVSTAKTLGIVSIVMIFVFLPACWICGGIGLSKANAAITLAQSYGDMMLLQQAQEAKKLNKIGLIIGLVLTGISILSAVLVLIMSAAAYSYF
ncbi:MAG: hypothetical protein IJ168_04615 [Eubacterium sp.]|nr:hypothetical protein [Eubacterium sp.]